MVVFIGALGAGVRKVNYGVEEGYHNRYMKPLLSKIPNISIF